RYIFNQQRDDGGWGLHVESESSTMFGSALNYVMARLLGVDKDHPRLVKAREWIKSKGVHAHYFQLTGCCRWSKGHSILGQVLVGSIGALWVGWLKSLDNGAVDAALLVIFPPGQVLVPLSCGVLG